MRTESEKAMINEEFYIPCDGISVHIKLDLPDSDPRADHSKIPMVLAIPGLTGHMEEPHMTAIAEALPKAGYACLRAELYGHGKSGGQFKDHTLYKWVTNALSVVAYARSLDFVTDLYLCGHSQGGLLTMLVGGMCADDFKAILPLSPAWMIPQWARTGTVLGREFDPEHIPDTVSCDSWELSGDYIRVAQTIHPEESIEKYKGKVLIVHGDKDETIPLSHAQKAAELYADAELVTIHGADHCFNGYAQQLASAVKDFFSKL